MFQHLVDSISDLFAKSVGEGGETPPRAVLAGILGRFVMLIGLASTTYIGYRRVEQVKRWEEDIVKLAADRDTAPVILLSKVGALRGDGCNLPALQVAIDTLDWCLLTRASDPANPLPIEWLRGIDPVAMSGVFPHFARALVSEEWRVRADAVDEEAQACEIASELNSVEDETGEPRFHFAGYGRGRKYFVLSEARDLTSALRLADDTLRASGTPPDVVHNLVGKFTCKPPGVHDPLPGHKGKTDELPSIRPGTSGGPGTPQAEPSRIGAVKASRPHVIHVRPYQDATYLALRATPEVSPENVIGRVRRGGEIKVLVVIPLPSGGTWLDISCESPAAQCLHSYSKQHLIPANQTNWFDRNAEWTRGARPISPGLGPTNMGAVSQAARLR